MKTHYKGEGGNSRNDGGEFSNRWDCANGGEQHHNGDGRWETSDLVSSRITELHGDFYVDNQLEGDGPA